MAVQLNFSGIRSLAVAVFLLTLGSPVVARAQSSNDLEIRGVAQINALPDEVTCMMRTRVIRGEYDDALKVLDRQLREVKKVLEKLDFPEEDIKSKSFSIGPNRVYRRGIVKDSGFVAQQDLEVTFVVDRDRALKIINEMAESKAEPSLSFGFGFSDRLENELEGQLIQQAVADAREKSTLIAGAAGVRLGPIKGIQYDPSPLAQPMMMAKAERSMVADESMDFGGFQVPEIELSRDVIIRWGIE